jgi:hypothetical protein
LKRFYPSNRNRELDTKGKLMASQGTKTAKEIRNLRKTRIRGRTPTAIEEILFEFAKESIKNSVSQSIEFNKTMLSLTATFATLMATIFGLVGTGSTVLILNLPLRSSLGFSVLLMLLSSICFAIGYYPQPIKINPHIVSTIKITRDKLILSRRRWSFFGIVFFCNSILALLVGLVWFNVN